MLRFPPHPNTSEMLDSDQSGYDQSSLFSQATLCPEMVATTNPEMSMPPTQGPEMPTPMQPLNHNFYHNFSRNSQVGLEHIQQNPQAFNIHSMTPSPAEIPKSSIWQKFPSIQDQVIKEHPSSTTNVQIHDHSNMSGYIGTTGTLTRRQDFNNEYSGTLPRPTATVKPLTPTGDMTGHYPVNNDVPVVCDDVCNDHNMPFANERLGTIRLKTNPQDAFAEFEKEEEIHQAKEINKSISSEASKSLLRTPTRAPNRSATDVMDDISSMLADLTTELDSMLTSDSVQ